MNEIMYGKCPKILNFLFHFFFSYAFASQNICEIINSVDIILMLLQEQFDQVLQCLYMPFVFSGKLVHKILALTMLWANSADDKTDDFSFIFPRK